MCVIIKIIFIIINSRIIAYKFVDYTILYLQLIVIIFHKNLIKGKHVCVCVRKSTRKSHNKKHDFVDKIHNKVLFLLYIFFTSPYIIET